MTGHPDHGGLLAPDPDATVVLPVVPPDGSMDAGNLAGGPLSASAGRAAADIESTGSVARNSAAMAVGSTVSRLTGFLRTAAIGAAIGAASVSDDYNLANTLPNMVYELLLGGVLASVIVPLLVRARANDPDRGEAYTHRLLSLATVFLGGATLVAVACAPLLTEIMAGTSPAADRRLITVLGYLLLPEIFFYGMAALFAAVLNTRGHFAAPMWTPILNNIVVILTAGVFLLLPSVGELTAENLATSQILVLGVGTTLGIVVQATGLWPALRRVGFRWRWRWDLRELHLSELARISGWMLGYVVVSQLGLVVVLRIAKLAGNEAGPGPAIFLNAFLIFMMAHGIVAVSIMTALMPRMSAAAAARDWADLADKLSLGTRLSAVILVPATVAYLVLGQPLGVTLFQWNRYTHDQALATGWVIAAAGLGLVPFAISQLQLAAFYAMPDTRTPALVNVPVVILRVAVDVLFWIVLPAAWVAAGLMIGNAVSYVFTLALGYWLLRRRIGRLGIGRILATLIRLASAALVAGVPAALVVLGLARVLGDGKVGSAIQVVVGGGVLVAGYVAAALALRVSEVRDLAGMLRGRLGR